MPEVKLFAYWGKWVAFPMECEELKSLRAFVISATGQVKSIASWEFKIINGALYYSNGGVPNKYYIEMDLSAVVVQIDKAIADFCH